MFPDGPAYDNGYNHACRDWEAYESYLASKPKVERELKILKKKLEISKSNEERLCSDHRGKRIGEKTGCVACDAEYFEKKRHVSKPKVGVRLPEKKKVPTTQYPTRKEMTDIGVIYGFNEAIDLISKMNEGNVKGVDDV